MTSKVVYELLLRSYGHFKVFRKFGTKNTLLWWSFFFTIIWRILQWTETIMNPSLARAVASPARAVLNRFLFLVYKKTYVQKNTSKVVYELLNRSYLHFIPWREAANAAPEGSNWFFLYFIFLVRERVLGFQIAPQYRPFSIFEKALSPEGKCLSTPDGVQLILFDLNYSA